MLGGASAGVNAESIAGTPRHRICPPTSPFPERSAQLGLADDIHNSAVRRQSRLFPYTQRLTQLPVTVDFPVLLLHSLPADMTATL
jgi:hypothetical protein